MSRDDVDDGSAILCSQMSPDGRREAFVESDGRALYFYIWSLGRPDRTHSCWVRNLMPAPAKLDVEGMRNGEAPALPRDYCRHPDGTQPPDPADLEIVWFPAGDGAAVLERGEILAILPPWTGHDGFPGYARDAIGECPLCWGMPPADSEIVEKVHSAALYWKRWDDEDVWTPMQDAAVDAADVAMRCKHSKYYAIDGGEWPPKAMLRYDLPEAYVLVTIGVCVRPQPEVGVDEPEKVRRIELACAIDKALGEDAIMQMARYISAQSLLLWENLTWLGDGHTIPCDSAPVGPSGSRFDAVLLTSSLDKAPRPAIAEYEGDPLNLLWLLPITEAEWQLAVDDGSRVLLARLVKAGYSWIHRDRRPVV